MIEDEFVQEQIQAMFRQARSRFGKAVRGCWVNEAPGCPGCGVDLSPRRARGGETISLNAYLHRPAGLLIGYFLCNNCAEEIFTAARRNPFRQIPLHSIIEGNLAAAYRTYLGKMYA